LAFGNVNKWLRNAGELTQQRAQQCLPKSLLLYADPLAPATPPRVHAATTTRLVVLDTNVVLDWLLFDHPDGTTLNGSLVAGELRWIATAAMRDELAHVLARGALDRWQPDLPRLWSAWDRHCTEVPAALVAGPASGLRCTDPDDQKFVDLAASRRGSLLLSRDRAVLKLARRLAVLGVTVTTPTAWVAGRGLLDHSPPC
jgi:predicted nucleic acid-binding protein